MTDKPKIEVGQRWVTRGGDVVRVLEVGENGCHPSGYTVTVRGAGLPYAVTVFGEADSGIVTDNLISLAAQTIKRELALYRWGNCAPQMKTTNDPTLCEMVGTSGGFQQSWRRISEPVTIEFSLLPGESA